MSDHAQRDAAYVIARAIEQLPTELANTHLDQIEERLNELTETMSDLDEEHGFIGLLQRGVVALEAIAKAMAGKT